MKNKYKKEAIEGILQITGPLIYHDGQLIDTGYRIDGKNHIQSSYFHGQIPSYFEGKKVRLEEINNEKYFGLVKITIQTLKMLENTNNISCIFSFTMKNLINKNFDWWKTLNKNDKSNNF
ncbi:hypothetical protein GW932_04520 [archaeon]|nr:hypothetical protein [archaeon]